MANKTKFQEVQENESENTGEMGTILDDIKGESVAESESTQVRALEGDEVAPADDIPTVKIGGMRFVPIRVAAAVLERSTKATGLSATDIINVSLVLFQNADRASLESAIASLNADKAEALFNSLK